MKILAITQARLSSTRLPGKVLLPLGSKTVLDLHLKRIKKSKKITHFMVATTQEPEAKKITDIAKSHGFLSYQGSLEDVLDRFYQAALEINPDVVVRLTSDCPLIDPEYVDDLIEKFLIANVDYASNCLIPNLPDGLDAEVFTFKALQQAWEQAQLNSEREHVTPYIWKNSDFKGEKKFRALAADYGMSLQSLRITLDQAEDYKVIKAIVDELGEDCNLDKVMSFLKDNPEVSVVNSNLKMNEGYVNSLKKDTPYDQ